MLELYNNHMSTCSQKVRLCLAEKALAWVDYQIDFRKRDQLKPYYLAINPNGVVPTLVDDGDVVIDSSVICEYLDETHPDSGVLLSPREPVERARMRSWMRYVEEVPTSAIRYPSFNLLFLRAYQALDKSDFDAFTEKMPLRSHFMQKMGQDGFDEDEMKASLARLRQTLERINAAIEDSDWIVANQYSLVEIGLTPTIVRMEDLNMTHMWDDLPHVQPWYDRIQARPSFDKAYYAGARIPIDNNPFARD
ncbi:MAG: glutathione S-transferase family protein [Pseudomonadota bacterium]